jgi:hypothetical protein
MAVSPTQVKYFDAEEIDRHEQEIDKKLRCAVVMPGGSFELILPGSLNSAEKTELTKRYEAVGWEVLRIRNSSENGERPGLFGIEFKLPVSFGS